jgi:hypothetical protein
MAMPEATMMPWVAAATAVATSGAHAAKALAKTAAEAASTSGERSPIDAWHVAQRPRSTA